MGKIVFTGAGLQNDKLNALQYMFNVVVVGQILTVWMRMGICPVASCRFFRPLKMEFDVLRPSASA